MPTEVNATTIFHQYQAGPNKTTSRFDISYRIRDEGDEEFSLTGSDDDLRNISCATLDTTYTAHVGYLNHIQNVTLEVVKEKPLNESASDSGDLFYDVLTSVPSQDGFKYCRMVSHNFSMEELYQYYHDVQIVSIRETLTRPITGHVAGVSGIHYTPEGLRGWDASAGIILPETPLAELVYKNESNSDRHNSECFQGFDNNHKQIYFRLSASIVERLMQNVTISLLNTATTTTTANVTTTVYKSAYVFESRERLVAAYFGILGVCLAFVLLGLLALLQNGTSASTGGFLQIMCTTTYSESIMNQIAREASTRGTVSLPKELLDLQVRYGSILKSRDVQGYMAFGTVEETEELLKSH
jgi:hypothetical protein